MDGGETEEVERLVGWRKDQELESVHRGKMVV